MLVVKEQVTMRTTSLSPRTKMAYVLGSSLADPGKIHYAGFEMRDACVVLGIGVGSQIVDRLYIFWQFCRVL
jgi:hypothetical protein